MRHKRHVRQSMLVQLHWLDAGRTGVSPTVHGSSFSGRTICGTFLVWAGLRLLPPLVTGCGTLDAGHDDSAVVQPWGAELETWGAASLVWAGLHLLPPLVTGSGTLDAGEAELET